MPEATSTNAAKAPNTAEESSILPQPRHDPLLTMDVKFYVPQTKSMISVKALIDSGASAPVMCPELAEKLGYQPRHPIRMTQADGTKLESNHMVSTKLGIRNREFQLDAEVLDLGGRQLIIGLSWLRENGFILDPVKRTLEKSGCVIQCSELNLPKVAIIETPELTLEKDDCIFILDVASEYPQYMEVFSEELANRMPPLRKWDHEITLQEGAKIPNGVTYKMTMEEEEALRKCLAEMLPTGKIRRSRSATAAPVLFVRKKNGSLRMCVDYRALNKLTIPNRYPLPRIDDLQEKVKGATWFTRLDLKNGYNLIRIKPGDEWKTAFKTKLGLYEYTVMPFGLMNAPSSFQEMMDEILRDLDHHTVWYIDDILIYTKGDESEHKKAVEQVLKKLLDHDLAVNLAKSEFHVQEINFLGYLLGDNTLRMEPGKIEAIQHWEAPTRKKEVQAFLGFANYYRRFIQNYASRVRPLTELTKGPTGTGTKSISAKVPFSWGQQQQEAFDDLKAAFQEAPVLVQFDRNRPTLIETDASNQAISGILSQGYPTSLDSDKLVWKLVNCHAKTLSEQQRNWPIHDKELWAIVSSLTKWRSWLSGLHVEVHTDHQGLQYFQTKQKLNARQARWQQDLAEFSYIIRYKPVATMVKADALSRKTGNAKEGIESQFFPDGTIATPVKEVRLMQILALESAYETSDMANGPVNDPEIEGIDVSTWEINKEGLRIPPNDAAKVEILRTCHDSGIAGHWGRHRTQELVARNFWWPKTIAEGRSWQEDVAAYVASCQRCQLAKADRHSKAKKLLPMPTGIRPWEEIAMDFVGELPESEGFNAILVITDRFTKMQRYIPARTTWTAEDIANVYITDVWRCYGLPRAVTSDRRPQFASAFLQALNKALDVRLRLSTAHHPQTDRLSERAIQSLKQYLRIYCHDRQNRWARWLPLAEFAYNSSPHSVTKLSPMFSLYGFEPRGIQVVDDGEMASPAAEDWLYRMTKVHNQTHATLKAVNDRRSAISQKMVGQEARKYKVGDWVLVDRRNLTIPEGIRALSDRWIGPYKVIKDVWDGHAYKLDIPIRTRIHGVIHVSLLKPYKEARTIPPPRDPILGQPDAASTDAPQDILYHIDKFIDSRWFGKPGDPNRAVKYRVRWLGYKAAEDTWQTIEESGWPATPAVLQAYRTFHDAHPRKATDLRVVDAINRL